MRTGAGFHLQSPRRFRNWEFKGPPPLTHALHSVEGALLYVSPVTTAQLAGSRGRGFLEAAPLLWNSLLRDAHPTLSLITFD